MVMRARTLLSGIISDRVYGTYQKLKASYDSGEMTKDDFVIVNAKLKEKLKKPEEIVVEEYDEELNEIDKWDFKEAIKKYEYERERFISAEKEIKGSNERLQQIIEQNEIEKDEIHEKYQKIISEKDREAVIKNSEIYEKNRRIKELEDAEKKRIKEEKIRTDKRNERIATVLIVVIVVAFIFFGIVYVAAIHYRWKCASEIGAIVTYIGLGGIIPTIGCKVWGRCTKKHRKE